MQTVALSVLLTKLWESGRAAIGRAEAAEKQKHQLSLYMDQTSAHPAWQLQVLFSSLRPWQQDDGAAATFETAADLQLHPEQLQDAPQLQASALPDLQIT